jgi:hypothetical protein
MWGEAEEERAAIVEFDGGIPRTWAEGFAQLDPVRPPADVPLRRWQRFVETAPPTAPCLEIIGARQRPIPMRAPCLARWPCDGRSAARRFSFRSIKGGSCGS